MGTRADFYIRRTNDAEWLGSVAMDGYPEGIAPAILDAKKEMEYRQAVSNFLDETSHATMPEQGWPWPWTDSNTSDYAYAWDNGVWYTIGYQPTRWWLHADGELPYDDVEKYEAALEGLQVTDFPNMEHMQNVTRGHRSGLVLFSVKE